MKTFISNTKLLLIPFLLIQFSSCSSDSGSEESTNPNPTDAENPTSTPVATTYESINQSTSLDFNQLFVVANGADARGTIVGAAELPNGLGHNNIREAHFDGSTPESVEARKTVVTYTFVGQSKRLTGTDVNLVSIGKNDDGIGNASIVVGIDRDDDDIPANGKATITKATDIGGSANSNTLNRNRGYNSYNIDGLEIEFILNGDDTFNLPDGTQSQSLSFEFNSEIAHPGNLLNFHDNGVTGTTAKTLSDVITPLEIQGEVQVNIFQVTTATGTDVIPKRSYKYSIGTDN